MTTMNNSQKKMFIAGSGQIKAQDAAMWSAISGHRPTSCVKLLFVVASCMMDKAAGIGQVTHFVDPGDRASCCTEPMMNKLKQDVELHNPSAIYAQAPWDEDNQTSPGHDNLIKFISEQEAKGVTCIIADTRHIGR